MSITLQNERQYDFTKTQLAKLEMALREAQQKMAGRDDVPDIVREGHQNGIRFLMDDLRAQLADYEQLRDGHVKSLPMQSVLAELPATLVRARIARGWTHKELALALGTSEQQVQKDESGGYAKASLDKLNRVAGALGVSLSGRARLSRPPKARTSKSVVGVQSVAAPRRTAKG